MVENSIDFFFFHNNLNYIFILSLQKDLRNEMYRFFRKRDNIINRDINSTRPFISYLALVREVSYKNQNPVIDDIYVDCGSDDDDDENYWDELYIGPDSSKEEKPSKEEDSSPPRKNVPDDRRDRWYSTLLSNLDYLSFSIGVIVVVLPLYFFFKEKEKLKRVGK